MPIVPQATNNHGQIVGPIKLIFQVTTCSCAIISSSSCVAVRKPQSRCKANPFS